MSKPITDFDVNNLDPFEALVWQFEMGADEAIADEPLDRFKASESLRQNAANRPGFGANAGTNPQRPAGASARPAQATATGPARGT